MVRVIAGVLALLAAILIPAAANATTVETFGARPGDVWRIYYANPPFESASGAYAASIYGFDEDGNPCVANCTINISGLVRDYQFDGDGNPTYVLGAPHNQGLGSCSLDRCELIFSGAGGYGQMALWVELSGFQGNFRIDTWSYGHAIVGIELVSSSIPVPAALPLLASGLGLMAASAWRRRRNAMPA
jgi:hypothetical protein